ncbi:MAG: hypothetical protein NZ518_07055, partial [Dehalococcoidia bacterium]|nr:hypothetical protein [Dehalococcoidia bacterium]
MMLAVAPATADPQRPAEAVDAIPPVTQWRLDDMPHLGPMRFSIVQTLDANRIEYWGRTGVIEAFWAGDAYHGVFARDMATVAPFARYLYRPTAIRTAVEEYGYFQYAGGPYAGLFPGVVHPGGPIDKATATSDEDTSVIHLAYVAYKHDAGPRWLRSTVNGQTVIARLNTAMQALFAWRGDPRTGLIWRANTTDWGDVKLHGGEHVTDYLPGEGSVMTIYDQALLFRALMELAEMNDAAMLPAVAAEWRRRAAVVRDNANALFWLPERGYYRARVLVTQAPFPGFDEDTVLGAGNIEAVRAGLADVEQARLIFRNFERARLEARSPKVGMVAWPPYPERMFVNYLPGEYQNGGVWDWWGGRQIEAEF